MDLGLHGRRALVTGGTQGIGLAIAAALADEGCQVVVAGRRPEVARQAAAALGDRVAAVAGDISDPASAQGLVDAAVDRLGGLDVLVNNAGQHGPRAPAWELGDDDWLAQLDGKLLGAVRITRRALPSLVAGDQPRIVNISGLSGLRIVPGAAVSALTNLGMVSLTAQLARELAADGVRVNCVVPGLTLTEATRQRAEQLAHARGCGLQQVLDEILARAGIQHASWGRPQDVADVACFLASARVRHVTGVALRVDGGQLGTVG